MAEDMIATKEVQTPTIEPVEVPSPFSEDEKTPGTANEASAPSMTEKPKTNAVMVMVGLCLAVFLAALDSVIIVTALPVIAEAFNTTGAGYAWIGSAYLLANAMSAPIWGGVSNIFGRKPMLMSANAIFMTGSLISALSGNLTILIVGRAIQGVGGGGLITLVNICVSDMFSMRERGKYFGLIGGTWAFAASIGPLIGGAFAQNVSWRWCFYVNLPCDAIALVILYFYLDVPNPRTPLIAGLKAIDWFGCIAIAGATLMFLLGLEFGGVSYPWDSPTVICLIVFGLMGFVIFFIIEWRVAEYPVIPLSIFSNMSSNAALMVCFCQAFTTIAISFYLSLYMEEVLLITPILSGVYIIPLCVAMSIFTIGTGFIINKTGRYLELIFFGTALCVVTFGLFITFPAHLDWPKLIVFQIIAGLGIGPLFQAPLIALQTNLKPEDTASGTAAFAFVRQLSSGISIVIGGLVFTNEMARKASTLSQASVPPKLVTELAHGSAVSVTNILKSLPPSQRMAVQSALADSLSKMWILYTAVAAVGFFVTFAIAKRELSTKHEIVKTGLRKEEVIGKDLV
ncbi:hypothetical protein MMC25_006419 [Agyrium rufum]|nr:hypothetical protein [Agyrium rufum]